MAATIIPCPSCGARNRVPAAAKGTPTCPQCRTVLPWLAKATDDDFDEVVTAAKVPVLVDLWAPWCAPCRQISPLLEKLATERAGQLKLVKVNVDDNPFTQSRFGVQAIPTLLLFRGGKQVSSQRGAVPMASLRSWIDSQL